MTIYRKTASAKLKSAVSATYFFQRGPNRYEHEVSVGDVIFSFEMNQKLKMEMDWATDQYTIYVSKTSKMQCGYKVQFPGERYEEATA